MTAIERRIHVRYGTRQEIDYDSPDVPGEIFVGSIINISHSGMCLYVSNPVRLGQEITVRRENQYYVKGIVVWCNESGGRINRHEVGLEFKFDRAAGRSVPCLRVGNV